MSSAAAAKKNEGNAFYAKQMYKEAANSYTEVRAAIIAVMFRPSN